MKKNKENTSETHFENQIFLEDVPKSETNLNAQWYGEMGIQPVNYVQNDQNSNHYSIYKAPPMQIPISLLDGYTMQGRVKIRWWYCDQQMGYGTLQETSLEDRLVDFTEEDPFRANTEKLISFKKNEVDELIEQVRDKSIKYYGDMAKCLHSAFEKFPIKDQNVAIMGSTHPVCEAYAIFYGATPNTIEYTKIYCHDERIKTHTVKEYYDVPVDNRVKFDAGISISSFEHDGLGKYGDPLDPNGDIKAMENMKNTIKKGGLLYLAVPCGEDRIDWNAHRVYGDVRLPLLFSGWELLGSYGFADEITKITPFHELEERKGYGYRHVLFILKNT
tara:strand:+ start:19049 stop:20044 length:996 start_codon:yes stop_codon:yes gene_type:complete